jgi:putative tryptophan/tyrosine transport system substrate-binding protein
MTNLNRRGFLVLLGAVAFPSVGGGCSRWEPSPGKDRSVPRVGYLGAESDLTRASYAPALRDGLRELGYVESRTIEIDWRYWQDRPGARAQGLAAELAKERVQVIVTSGTPAVVAAAEATRSIPIVSAGPSRGLVDLGLVERDIRPGGNVTGTGGNVEVYGKLVEYLKETVPSISRIGYVRNPDTPGSQQQMALSQAAAAELRLDFLELQVRRRDEVAAALSAAQAAQVNGLVVSADAVFGDGPDSVDVVQLALQYRLPAIYSQVAGYLERGGLLAFSPDFVASHRRAAAYVDKILRGASPAELPVEQAMTFEFGVNLKTARTMGITIPDQLLLQATQIVQ